MRLLVLTPRTAFMPTISETRTRANLLPRPPAAPVESQTPKTKAVSKRVKRIKLWIDKNTYLTSKIEYVEGDGDITRYEFTNVRINEPVPASRFAISLPSNVKVEQMKLQ